MPYLCFMQYISFQEASQLVLGHAPTGKVRMRGLMDALGLYAAEDIRSSYDHPFFDQTAVDGYALRFEDLGKFAELKVVEHLRAGSGSTQILQPGTCARIFTGAALPPGSDTVVMQEHTSRTGDLVTLNQLPSKLGANVRYRGEQIRAGQVAIPKHTPVNPGNIGFLASLGILEIPTYSPPTVAVLTTGDEFAQNAVDFCHGKIFESNGIMLKAALATLGIHAETHRIPESREELLRFMQTCTADLIIGTGGVSVGDHDYTRAAFEAAGFQTIFHQVKQKPGKPLLFSQKGHQTAFGLPGNPRAAMMGFYIYILPWIQTFMGSSAPGLITSMVRLSHAYHRKPDGKTHFITARVHGGDAQIDNGQNSHMLNSFNTATHILILPEEGGAFEEGTMLKALRLAGV